ncbi:trypsin-like peptidase domain-containing protein [Roseomonas gilardii]|uniref:trypsin-like peptidase domain-containing protein n=1 Tax=Roseomonas gilardii TaxID=257708 RepID=UPI00200B8B75|nr:trypsin-like peptidase domain-containing protein [Roseomonas gilardii]
MRNALLLSLAGMALLLAPAAAQTGPQPTPQPAEAGSPFRILNRTGAEATQLFAVRSGRSDWGGNLLKGPLAPEAAYTLRPAAAAGCRFDIRLVAADGREAVQRGQDICGGDRTVTLSGLARPAAPTPPEAQPKPGARASSGTGFLVARERVMTNRHVINGCDRVLVRAPDGRNFAAVPPAKVDAKLDLALIAVPGLDAPPIRFRTEPVRRGDGVVAYGFPLTGLLSSDPKLTRGEVNGLNGLGNDPNQFQISAPVQPGNSGGPLLDMRGELLGVVVSKLNAEAVAKRTGDIAQNINFAVKGERAAAFLRASGIEPLRGEGGPDRGVADVGEIANRSTVFIRCEKG